MTISQRNQLLSQEADHYKVSELRLDNAIDALQQMLGITELKDQMVDCWNALADRSNDDELYNELYHAGFDFESNNLNYHLETFTILRDER